MADYEIIPSKAVAQVSYQLLQNPGAEQGLAGWTVNGFVAATNPHSGEKCFTGSGDSTWAYQDVDISNYSTDINNGNGFIHFKSWFYSESHARLFIDVTDENSTSLLVQTL